jgi:hypothetical protein
MQRYDFDVGVDRLERRLRGFDFDRADGIRPVEDLTLQVSEVDLVRVGDGQPADAGGGEVERSGAAESARADDQRARCPQPLLSFDPDFGKKDVAAIAKELLVVQLAEGLAGCFGASVCATVGDWLFTGSPLRKAIACASWKSSFEPISVGFWSAGGVGAGTGAAGFARGAEACSFCCALFSRWRCRSASRTRITVSVGSSTMMSGVMPSAWIERPLGV